MISFNLSNVGKFFWCQIVKDCDLRAGKEKYLNPFLVFTSFINVKLRRFTS